MKAWHHSHMEKSVQMEAIANKHQCKGDKYIADWAVATFGGGCARMWLKQWPTGFWALVATTLQLFPCSQVKICTGGCRKYANSLFSLKIGSNYIKQVVNIIKCISKQDRICKQLAYLETIEIFGFFCWWTKSKGLTYFFGQKLCA